MNLTNTDQIFKIIESVSNILIVLEKNYSGDALCSALALSLFLQKKGKKITLSSSNKEKQEKFSFISEYNNLKNEILNSDKFTIIINTSKTKAKELSYEPKNDQIEIYLTPENGKFGKEDVKILTGSVNFDLVISIGSCDLKNLGEIYDENIDFFYNTPIVNIDINPLNERFGQINLIELGARSISEIVFELLNLKDNVIIDEEIATCLLAGITDKTSAFKFSKISPKLMSASSKLIELGAKREEVISNLYRTKTIKSLKYWGKILSKMNSYSEDKLVWSILNEKDVSELNLEESINFEEIVNELVSDIPDLEIAVLFTVKDDLTEINVITTNKLNALDITSEFGGTGNITNAIFAVSSRDADQVAKLVIDKFKEKV